MIHELNNKNAKVSHMIFSIFQRSYRLEAAILGIDDFPPLNRTVKQIANANSKFIGFTKNETLAGVIELEYTETQIEIASLVVDIKFLRKGIASSLINHAIALFPDIEKAVSTAVMNLPAIKLYKKSGFQQENTWVTDCGLKMASFKLNPK